MLALTGPARAAKDELVIGMTQFPSTLNPLINSMLAKSYVLAMTRRPLTVYDADWKLICMLCIELPTIENGLAVPEDLPDGKQGIAVTYRIHPNAKWGDGMPVSARDVVFGWEVGRHPLTGVSDSEPFRRITRIDVKDAQTFTVHVDKLTFDYNARYTPPPLPAHLERKPFSEPKEYRNRTLYDTDSTNPGLYYGPYRITEVVPGSHLVLERNPTWWGKAPHFRRIVVRVIEKTAALEANLLSGSIDYISGELGLTLDQALALEKRQGKRFRILYKAGLIYEHIDLNMDNPALKDRRLRRALIYAIDREAISSKLFAGRQPVAHGFVSPLDGVHANDLPTYPYDPKKAAALLDAAGWSVMKKGIRHNAASERLSLEIMTTAGNRSRELVQQVLQSQWRAVGIDVRIRNQPARVFFGQTVTQRRFSAMAMFAWISAPENVPRGTLHSEMIPTPANNFSGQNYTGFRNGDLDRLIDAIEIELDPAKRGVLWGQLQKIYATELPVIPLYFRASPYVLPKWLKGVRPTGHTATSTLWVENWRAE
jgi:peptide/nickel transport system substrate-binding protein